MKLHLPLLLIVSVALAQADLADYDALIAADEAAGRIHPVAKLTSPIKLHGTSGVPFDFGGGIFDKTIEFIVMGNPSVNSGAVLAVGQNTPFELRFEQWNDTGKLGFTHLGVKDYTYTEPTPLIPTHVCYRWDELDIGGNAGVDNMEIYINGDLHQTIKAPGFKMPKNDGFLGARNGSGTAGMVGRIDRVTVHLGGLRPDFIKKYATAFLAQPYQTSYDPVSIDYDASASDKNPVDQGWTASETAGPGLDSNGDGLLDGTVNVGEVNGPAWQIYDHLADTAFDGPRYRRGLTPSHLTSFFENGWTLTAKVRAVGVENNTSSFIGWQFRKGHDPGYCIGAAAARVGFHIYEGPNNAFAVHITGGETVFLGANSANEPHTVRAEARPRSPGYEWFIDDVSQGYLDLRDFPYGNDESIFFGANSSVSRGDASDWFEISLASGASVDIPETTRAVAREVRGHDDSLVTDSIDGATGSFMRAHDLLTVQGVREVDFPIYYDSQLTARVGPLGYGWSHPYEARLVSYSGNRVIVYWDANRYSEFLFDRIDAQGVGYYTGVDEDVQYAELLENANGFTETFPFGSWQLTLLDGSVYAFSRATGCLIYAANSARQGLDLEYDSSGRLAGIQEKFTGARIDLAYNERGLISQVSDPLGREVDLSYDAEWRLEAIPAPVLGDESSERKTQFTYEGRLLTAGHDLLGEPLFSCAYDSLGRAISQDDGRADTPATSIAYTALAGGSAQTQVIDPAGHVYTLVHDAGFHLLSATNPLGHQVTFTYDAKGNRISRTDARGNTTGFAYDANTGDLVSVTGPGGNLSSFEYESDHFVSKITDAFVETDGSRRSTTLDYVLKRMVSVEDAAGNVDRKRYHDSTGKLREVTLADGAQLAFDPNPSGPIEQASDPNDPSSPPASIAAYDLAGRLIKSKTKAGYETSIDYNAVGDVIARTDPEGNTETMEYDHRGRRVRTTDKRGHSSTNTFDGNNNLLTTTNAVGATTTYAYDVLDRLVRITNALGHSVSYRYDAIGRRIATTDALGRTTRTEFDAAGNVIAQIDSKGVRTLAFTYNSRDLVTKIEDAYGHEVTFTYDSVSRRTSMTDAQGRTTNYHYDKLDRPTGVTDPLNRTSVATYESDDVLDTLQAPGAAPVRFAYNSRNHLTSADHANGDDVRYLFNSDDQLTRLTIGQRYQDFRYDSLGRMSTDRIKESLGTENDFDRRFLYDANSNLTSVESKRVDHSEADYIVRHTRTYDALNRLASYTDEAGNTVSYTYDLLGNQASIVYPDGWTVSYGYDAANRLTMVADGDGRVTRYTYDRRDYITKIEMPNGTSRHLSYDSGGRLLKREDLDATGGLILSYHYAYDASGQIQSEAVEPDEGPLAVTAHDFGYNNMNQLVSFDGGALTYDPGGNLVQAPSASGLSGLAYNARGRLKQANGYRYDYDEEDRLVGWEIPFGAQTTFVLNPNAVMSQILTKTESDGTYTRYVYGIGLIYEETAGETRTHHYDQRGSAAAFSGNSGQTIGRVTYSPYGKVAQRTGDTDSIFLFNGLYGVIAMPGGELNYMRFRFYWPEVGRFITADAHLGSVGLIASLNRYGYAGGNPVMRVDPRGEFIHILGGALVGAVVNVVVELGSAAIEGRAVTLENVASAAAGGAVAGGLIAATGGASAGVLAVIGAGAAGGATENLVGKAISGEAVDLSLVGDTLAGGVAGAAGLGAAKLLGKAGGKIGGRIYKSFGGKTGRVGKITRKLFTPSKISKRRGIRGTGALRRKELAEAAVFDLGFGIAFNQAQRGIESLSGGTQSDPVIVPPPGGQGGDPSNTGGGVTAVYRQGLHELNAERPQRYGEHLHYDLFLKALSLAGRPIPNNPSNTLAGF